MSTSALESIFQVIPDLIFRFNQKGDFLECYTTKSKLLVVPADLIKGKNLTDLFEVKIANNAIDCIRKALETNRECSFEYSLPVSGSTHYFEARMVPSDHGEVVSFIRDITDGYLLRRKNDELVKINEELDSFIYRASHDLRAPLSSILGLTEIGLLTGNAEEMKSCLMMIRERIQAQDQVIHDIIDYARNLRTDVSKERFNLKFLVFEVIDTLLFNEGADKIDFQIDIADDFEVEADKVRLNIILSNLISNAIRYHDFHKEKLFIKVSTKLEGSLLFVSVEDNGQGIPENQHDKIFTMFYRASEKSKGSGLGLFIVKDTVEKLGGTIVFKSTYRQGSSFTFSILL